MGKLAQTTQGQTIEAANPAGGIRDLLSNNWEQIRALMPRSMTSERLFQLSVTAVNHTPGLLEASPETLLSCVMKCAALGLEPSAVDGLGSAYILPFRNHGRMEAQFILGYKGMLRLCRNSGQIESIEARAVHEGDTFEFEYGLNETLRHIPRQGGKGGITHVYCIAKFKDGGHYIDVMTKEEVDEIRARSKASQNGPWKTDYEAMARKTVIRRAFPYLPVSVEAQEAVASDERTPDYSGIFNPAISASDAAEAAQSLPDEQASDEPTEGEKDELRSLTARLVEAGYDEHSTKGWLFGIYKEGGIDAARDAAEQAIATPAE